MLKEQGLIQDLYRHLIINKSASRDELRALGVKLGYDYSTADRKLRKLTELGFIRPHKGSKGFNDSYLIIEPKHATVTHFETNLTPRKSISEDLNSQLIEVLQKVPLSWDSQEHIRSINLAIKSNNDYLKKSVLSQYQGEL